MMVPNFIEETVTIVYPTGYKCMNQWQNEKKNLVEAIYFINIYGKRTEKLKDSALSAILCIYMCI